jgi:hypothetical protein
MDMEDDRTHHGKLGRLKKSCHGILWGAGCGYVIGPSATVNVECKTRKESGKLRHESRQMLVGTLMILLILSLTYLQVGQLI